MAEAYGVAGPDGSVAQGLGQEGLAHASRSHQQHVLVPGQELQGEGDIQEPAVEGDGGGPVEVLQAAGLLEAGVVQSQFQAAVRAAIDLVAEDDFQEGGLVQLVPAGQGNAFGRGAAWRNLARFLVIRIDRAAIFLGTRTQPRNTRKLLTGLAFTMHAPL